MPPPRRIIALAFVSVIAGAGMPLGAQEQAELILLTGTERGTYHRFGQALAQIAAEAQLPFRLVATPSTGSVNSIYALSAHEADLAIVQSDVAHAAWRGEEPFTTRSIRNVQAVMGLYYEDVLVIARKGLHLRSAAGIRPGLRIVVGARESGTYSNAQRVLGAIGLPLAQVTPVFAEPRQSIALLGQDSVDIVFLTAGADDSLFSRIEASNAEVVSLGTEVVEDLLETRPYYEPTTLTFGGQGINTVRIRALLVASSSVPAEQVAMLVRASIANLGVLRAAHSRGTQILPSNAATIHAIGLHEGAQQVYCELEVHGCGTSVGWLGLLAVLLVVPPLLVWKSAPFRTFLLRVAPRMFGSLFGAKGVTHRYRLILIPVLLLGVLLLSAFVVQHSERAYSQAHNVHSDFEDIGLNSNLVWMLVFTASGFEDGRFPKSPVGKITSALMNWVCVGSVFLLVGMLTSDTIARKMKMRLQSHPENLTDHVIVCGWNRGAASLLRALTQEALQLRQQKVALVCTQPRGFLANLGIHEGSGGEDTREDLEEVVVHVEGDPTNYAVLERAGITRAHTVVILAEDPPNENDGRALLTLVTVEKNAIRERKLELRRHDLRSIVEVRNPEHAQLFREAYADVVVCSADFDAKLLSNSVINPGLTSFLDEILDAAKGNDVFEVPVTGRERPVVVGQTFDEILLEFRATGAMLVAIHQDGAPGALTPVERASRVSATGAFALQQRVIANPTTPEDRSYRVAIGDSLLFLAADDRTLEGTFGSSGKWHQAFVG